MTKEFRRNVFCLLGLPFDAVNMSQAARHVRDAVARREPCFLSTPNLNFVIGSLSDRAFRDSVINSQLSVVDGMPLVWIARLLGIPLRERVAGSDLFEQLRGDDVDKRMTVYFFGGEDGVAETASRRLNEADRGLVCTGYESPGFGEAGQIGDDLSIARINASKADFLAVSLGARKGQEWIERHRSGISVPVICHLGAVVNFVAGKVRRAPSWMRRTGLEWLWRIAEEPGLWRRYVNDGVTLLKLLATHVAPLAWHLRHHRPAAADLARAECELIIGAGRTVIRLRGAWVQSNLDKLRGRFAAALLAQQDVRLDMSEVSHVDCAFVGLTMLLFGKLQRRGDACTVAGSSAGVQRVFDLSCASFLLESPAPDHAIEPARAPAAPQRRPARVGLPAANDEFDYAKGRGWVGSP